MRINKLTDYSIILMANMVINSEKNIHTAKGLSEETEIPLPTVTRIMKLLSNKELLESQRGPQGGYSLIRTSQEISVADVIEAMEGPISLTECSSDNCHCIYEDNCDVGKPWQKINRAIRKVLKNISLDDMVKKDGNNGLLQLTSITEGSF
tara:strand:+ start:107 stop:559 length:453 start_codon:yes stop_codon:yes gene_type:complete